MIRLFRGQVDRPAYLRLLRSLLPVYRALESPVPNGSSARWSHLGHARLARAAALEADLEALGGAGWRSVEPVAATSPYVERIERLKAQGELGLLSHGYVRYLGDLSGGQALARVVGRTLGLEPGSGLAFYSFAEIPDHDRFKADYRAGLDSMEVTPAEADAVVAEACYAFRLNTALFEDLEGLAGG